MIANPNFIHLSPDGYLAAEEKSSVKHEYRQGEVLGSVIDVMKKQR